MANSAASSAPGSSNATFTAIAATVATATVPTATAGDY